MLAMLNSLMASKTEFSEYWRKKLNQLPNSYDKDCDEVLDFDYPLAKYYERFEQSGDSVSTSSNTKNRKKKKKKKQQMLKEEEEKLAKDLQETMEKLNLPNVEDFISYLGIPLTRAASEGGKTDVRYQYRQLLLQQQQLFPPKFPQPATGIEKPQSAVSQDNDNIVKEEEDKCCNDFSEESDKESDKEFLELQALKDKYKNVANVIISLISLIASQNKAVYKRRSNSDDERKAKKTLSPIIEDIT